MNKVFLSIGSNQGRRLNHLKAAILKIKSINFVEYVLASPVYETKPMYNSKQDFFLNMVVEIETSVDALSLLRETQNIERIMGRKKMNLKNQPRVIDIDILDYENMTLSDKELTLPHPAIFERIFVLKPWSDIAPRYKLPNIKKNIYELMSDIELNADIIKLYNSII